MGLRETLGGRSRPLETPVARLRGVLLGRRFRARFAALGAALSAAFFAAPSALLSGALFVLSPGSSWAEEPAAPRGGRIPLVRVGVAAEVEEIRLGARGAWFLGVVGARCAPTKIGDGEVWTMRAAEGGVAVLDHTSRPRGTRRDTLYAYPSDLESGRLLVNGRPYRGECLVYGSKGRVTAVNVIDLESYLRAVLPMEMGPQPPGREQALRAQAVAARSYTLSMLGRWSDRGFDLLPTVEDQVYGGVEAEKPGCTVAVEETRGEVAVQGGAPIRAFYSSTCGGHTAAADEVWDRPPASYLRAVRDRTGRVDRSFCRISPFFEWKESWPGARLEEILRSTIPRVRPGWDAAAAGPLTGVTLRERSASRRVSCLRLSFRKGHVDLAGDEIRWTLRRANGEGLRSALLTRVQATRRRGRIVSLRVEGQGYGHGVGLCQYGAMGMAEAGYGHQEIIRFYYRGTQVRRFY